MSILTALRDRFSSPKTSPGPASGDQAADAQLPFSGYDRLDDKDVVDALSDHSQAELEAVEAYERAHQNRGTVLDKLRYMRGSEPLPGYDALGAQEIVGVLQEADMETIKKVRGYERKFANRPDVLEEVVRALHRDQAAHPAGAPPAYQPMSASATGDRSKTASGP